MNKDDSAILGGLGCVGLLAMIPLATVLNGMAFRTLWAWFVIPIFHLPSLTIAQAIGVSMVVSFLTYQSTSTDKDQPKWMPIAMLFIKPAISLGCGWTVRLFL